MNFRLEIVGGGYDHLAFLSRAGARVLSEADRVLHYAGVAPGAIRALAPAAGLASWDDLPYLLERLEHLDPGTSAVLLGDGVACPRLQAAMASLAGRGLAVGYHPARSLADEALRRAGFLDPGKAAVHPLPATALADGGGERPRWFPDGGTVLAVGFDTRVLWPARRVDRQGLAALASRLPSGGWVFAVVPSAGAGPDFLGTLAGRGVLVTRTEEQSGEMALPLLGRGATPFVFPVLALEEMGAGLPTALSHLAEYHGVILTSVNAVDRFMDALAAASLDARHLAGHEILAVGSRTAEALELRGLRPDAVPGDFRAEGLLALLEAGGVTGRRYLLPRAEEAREVLPMRIRELGGEVDVVALYRVVRGNADPAVLDNLAAAGVLDAVTFASGSAVKHFAKIAGPERAARILASAVVACLGPVTAAAAREAGFSVTVVAPRSTVDDLVEALENHFRNETSAIDHD